MTIHDDHITTLYITSEMTIGDALAQVAELFYDEQSTLIKSAQFNWEHTTKDILEKTDSDKAFKLETVSFEAVVDR